MTKGKARPVWVALLNSQDVSVPQRLLVEDNVATVGAILGGLGLGIGVVFSAVDHFPTVVGLDFHDVGLGVLVMLARAAFASGFSNLAGEGDSDYGDKDSEKSFHD